MCPGLVSLTCFHSKHFQISSKWVSCRFVGWSRLVRGELSLFTHFTCCSFWPGSLMSCVSFRLSRKPWRSIALCGTWIWQGMTLVPRELRPGLYRMCWALWLRLNPHQGVSRVWWCFLWANVACLISVWLLVMCPGLVSLTCFHLNHCQISFKWVMSIRRFAQFAQRWAKSFKFWQLLTRSFDVLCFFQALAEALKTNSSVRGMNLEYNRIGPEGAQARPVSDVLGPLA